MRFIIKKYIGDDKNYIHIMFNEDKFIVYNIRDYDIGTEHKLNADIEYFYIWSNVKDVWNSDQIEVTVGDDECLVQEVNKTVGQGRFISIKTDIINKLIEDNIIEPVNK